MIPLILKTILIAIIGMGIHAFLSYHAVSLYMLLEYGKPIRRKKEK